MTSIKLQQFSSPVAAEIAKQQPESFILDVKYTGTNTYDVDEFSTQSGLLDVLDSSFDEAQIPIATARTFNRISNKYLNSPSVLSKIHSTFTPELVRDSERFGFTFPSQFVAEHIKARSILASIVQQHHILGKLEHAKTPVENAIYSKIATLLGEDPIDESKMNWEWAAEELPERVFKNKDSVLSLHQNDFAPLMNQSSNIDTDILKCQTNIKMLSESFNELSLGLTEKIRDFNEKMDEHYNRLGLSAKSARPFYIKEYDNIFNLSYEQAVSKLGLSDEELNARTNVENNTEKAIEELMGHKLSEMSLKDAIHNLDRFMVDMRKHKAPGDDLILLKISDHIEEILSQAPEDHIAHDFKSEVSNSLHEYARTHIVKEVALKYFSTDKEQSIGYKLMDDEKINEHRRQLANTLHHCFTSIKDQMLESDLTLHQSKEQQPHSHSL